MIEKYFNIGDIVLDSLGEKSEVLDYVEIFDGTLSLKETETVFYKNLRTGVRKRIHQNELTFVKSNGKFHYRLI